jgi:hypothetical protein
MSSFRLMQSEMKLHTTFVQSSFYGNWKGMDNEEP